MNEMQMKAVPKQSRSKSMVGYIFSACEYLLEELGSFDFTVRDVSYKSGVAIGSIYQYFHSKDSLNVLLCDYMAKETRTLLFDLLEKEDETSVEKINRISTFIVDRFYSKRKQYFFLMKFILNNKGDNIIKESRREAINTIAQYLSEKYDLEVAYSYETSFALVTSTLGILHNFLIFNDEFHNKKSIEAMVRNNILYTLENYCLKKIKPSFH